jgi:3'-5' exoribonuclease
MPPLASTIARLSELADGQDADFFALLVAKEPLTTRDGKPYFRVAFRDAEREVRFPIWNDSTWSIACRDEWTAGQFYKLRASYRDTQYGPQLDIQMIRPVTEADSADGFEPTMCLIRSRFDPQEMFDSLIRLVRDRFEDGALAELVCGIMFEHQELLLELPAAKQNHHSELGGYLEHVLSVSTTCAYLADKYAQLHNQMEPPLDKDLVVAGGILHDIGKVREMTTTPAGAEYTAAGTLIGHILQGRDIVREAAQRYPIDDEKLLRLEHIIVAHQRLPEWGSPKPPMTPEALMVHHADDLDAKLKMMANILANETIDGPLTGARNPLKTRLFRGAQRPQENLPQQ